MQHNSENLDAGVRAHVYNATMRTGTPPQSVEVARALSTTPEAVRESFTRLAEAHVLVLQPGSGEILMANPFSAVPTPFRVQAGAVSAYGNCIWDALGIPAMLRSDAKIITSCGDCGASTEITVSGDAVRGDGILHFAVPAREWWNDIVFT